MSWVGNLLYQSLLTIKKKKKKKKKNCMEIIFEKQGKRDMDI